ncbi:MAG: cupin domain-containing protein [Silicimonas sp.]|nr:cupin domain-containing protein [Silicimonas sp.]
MAVRVALSEAADLDLPGRRSRELVSGASGANSTLRLVEIAVPEPEATPRPPHYHPDSEECIHVLSGKGVTRVDDQDFQMNPGDTIRIAPGERHVTRNTGSKPLVMLCFFPAPSFEMLMDDADG